MVKSFYYDWSGLIGHEQIMKESVYDFKVKDINGQEVSMSDYSSKVLLICNVASTCGFTPQYAGLQKIYDNFENPAKQSVDLKNIRSTVYTNYIEPNPLEEAFNSLSRDQRKNVQINLKVEGFYSSTIDGYYGKNTEKGLKKYNSSFLDASDLEKSINIDALLTKLSKVVNPQED